MIAALLRLLAFRRSRPEPYLADEVRRALHPEVYDDDPWLRDMAARALGPSRGPTSDFTNRGKD